MVFSQRVKFSQKRAFFQTGDGKDRAIFGIPGQAIKKFHLCQLFGVFFRLIIETEERIKTCQGESRCKRTGERQASEDGGDRCSGPGIRNSVGQTDGIMIM